MTSGLPAFWIYRGSEYSRVLKMLLVLNVSGFWIYHGSMPGLRRVPNMLEYAKICLNGFCFTFTHFNPLSKGSIDCFLYYSSWKYLILIFVLDRIFLQARFQICCYLWGRGPWFLIYPTNDIPNKCIFIYYVVAVFPLFGASKELIRDSWRL